MNLLTDIETSPYTDLSPPGNAAIAREADALRQTVAQSHTRISEVRPGSRLALDGFRFHLLRTDRNAVFHVTKESAWYLKIPLTAGADVIRREIAGWRSVCDRLAADPEYLYPAAVQASLAPAMLLTAELPGKPLHRALYLASFVPNRPLRAALLRGMYGLGAAVASLHEQPLAPETLAANRPIVPVVEQLLANNSPSDATSQRIRTWVERLPVDDTAAVMLHGNLKLENILYSAGRISLIDLENSGYGPAQEDISWPLSQLLLTECVWGYPHSICGQAMSSLMDGYTSRSACDEALLARWTALRICRYYLELRTGKFGRPRIAGLPVRLPRLQRLVEHWTQDITLKEWLKCKS